MDRIPLVDLQAQHRAVADTVEAGFRKVMERTAFVLGEEVDEFERAFAAFTGVAHCVGVGNGTDAIELALRALEIGLGDEVIIPANTFVATAEAVVRAGATPVLVDCDEEYLLIDRERALERVGSATRAVVPVHLFGQIAAVEELRAGISDDRVAIVEDAAQCQGATRFGRGPGTVGDVASTSFYPGKNLGAYGDAGAVFTNRDDVDRKIRIMRDHGSAAKYEHTMLGCNSRLDTLQAVVLSAKLEYLAQWNEARRAAACRYDEMLGGIDGVRLPRTLDGNLHAWHLYVVRVPRRDVVLRALHDAGIGAGIHYPRPVHLHGAFAGLGYGPGSFPVAEQAATEILSLPLFAEITPEQQARVAHALAEALR